MSHEEIFKLAREAGIADGQFDFQMVSFQDLTDFAALVAQAEREACAKVVERRRTTLTDDLAAEIRAREALGGSEAKRYPANEWIEYDPESGHLYWRVRAGKALPGAKAGHSIADGRVKVKFDGRFRFAHQIAVKAMTGEWPEADVVHINGDKSDNRWSNLKQVTRSYRIANRPQTSRRNKTGFRGVSANGGGFIAMLRHNKAVHYLGRFNTAEEAHVAYMNARNTIFQQEVPA